MGSSVLILVFLSGLAAVSATTNATPAASTPAPSAIPPTAPPTPAPSTSWVPRTPPPQPEVWSYNMSNVGKCDPKKPVLCAPPDWGLISNSDCAGGSRQQSPIDFRSANFTDSADYGMMDLDFTQLPCNQAKFFQDKHASSVQADVGNCDGKFYFTFKGSKYKLISFRWRAPSEHQIDGQSYPMELQMKHKRFGAGTATDDIIMLGMWVNVGPESTGGFTAQMQSHMPFNQWNASSVDDRSATATSAVNLSGTFSPYDFFLPTLYESGGYLAYNGSFTAPLCRSPVLWLFLSKPVTTNQAGLDAYRQGLNNIPAPNQLNFNQPEPVWAGDAWGNGPSPMDKPLPTAFPYQHPIQRRMQNITPVQPTVHQPGWDLTIGCNNRPPQAGAPPVHYAKWKATPTTMTTTTTVTTTTTSKQGICSGHNMWFCILLPLLFCCCIPLAALLAWCCCPKTKVSKVKRSVPVPVAVPEPAPVLVEPEVVEPLILPAQGKWVQPYKNVPVTTTPPVTTKTTYEKAYEEVIYEPVTAYRAVGTREVAAPVTEVTAVQQFPVTEVVAAAPVVTAAQQYTGGSVSFVQPRVGVAPSYTYR